MPAFRSLTVPLCCLLWTATAAAQSTLWSEDFGDSTALGLPDDPRLLGDVDGDGRADLIGFGSVAVFVAFSTGASFGPTTSFPVGMSTADGWSTARDVRTTADVDGDGRQDLVGFGPDGTYVALSTGTSFATATRWSSQFGANTAWNPANYPRMLGDVDGDGRADCICFGAAGVYVARSTGSSFRPAVLLTQFGRTQGWTTTNHVRAVADVNGDGRADVVGFGNTGVVVALGTSTGGLAYQGYWTHGYGSSQGWAASSRQRTLADVDGDGRDDIVAFSPSGIHVALSTGGGFGPDRDTAEFRSELDVTAPSHRIGDFDGDHRADIAEFALGTWSVRGTNSGRFTPAARIAWEFGTTGCWEGSTEQRFVGDIDGDGRDDLVGIVERRVYANTSKRAGPHVLQSPCKVDVQGSGIFVTASASLFLDAPVRAAGAPFTILEGSPGSAGAMWGDTWVPLMSPHTFSGSMGTLDALGDARVVWAAGFPIPYADRFVAVYLDPVIGNVVSNWVSLHP